MATSEEESDEEKVKNKTKKTKKTEQGKEENKKEQQERREAEEEKKHQRQQHQPREGKKKEKKLTEEIHKMLSRKVSDDQRKSANITEEANFANVLCNSKSEHVVSIPRDSSRNNGHHVHSEGSSKRKRKSERVDKGVSSGPETSATNAAVSEPVLEESTQKFGERQLRASKSNDNQEGTSYGQVNSIPTAARKKKKVTFGTVSVFGGEDGKSWKEEDEHSVTTTKERVLSCASRLGSWRADRTREDLVWAKRFTKDEDETLRKAVFDYIKSRGWVESDGLDKVLNGGKEAHGCWMEISESLPHRPVDSIARRVHRLLDDVLFGKWSQEEENSLRSLHLKFGQDWKKIAFHLGRGRKNVKDKWRNMKFERAKGRWTQQELFRLCRMVHENLRMKSILKLKEKPSIVTDHRMLREDINWQLISDKLGSRPHGSCANEWYRTLASSMVAEGEWANEDDRLFLLRLLESGASEEEAVDWHNLLKDRSGFSCMKRWKQMVKHLGESSHLPFDEKLRTLTERYAPDLLEDNNFGDGCTRQP